MLETLTPTRICPGTIEFTFEPKPDSKFAHCSRAHLFTRGHEVATNAVALHVSPRNPPYEPRTTRDRSSPLPLSRTLQAQQSAAKAVREATEAWEKMGRMAKEAAAAAAAQHHHGAASASADGGAGGEENGALPAGWEMATLAACALVGALPFLRVGSQRGGGGGGGGEPMVVRRSAMRELGGAESAAVAAVEATVSLSPPLPVQKIAT